MKCDYAHMILMLFSIITMLSNTYITDIVCFYKGELYYLMIVQ